MSIDELIAQHVFKIDLSTLTKSSIPLYSKSITEAFGVVYEMSRKEWDFKLETILSLTSPPGYQKQWRATFLWLADFEPLIVNGVGSVVGNEGEPYKFSVSNVSCTMAICLAALTALKVEIPNGENSKG